MSHTRHLTPIEDICYRRVLDYYYLHEKPINLSLDSLARVLLLSKYTEQLTSVMHEFFVFTPDGFTNPRADKEIKQYQGFKDAGKRGADKRWAKAGDSPPNPPPIANNNHKPLTNNHKPVTKVKPSREVALVTDHAFETFWSSYPKKVGKDSARKAWNKTKPLLDDVLHALHWQRDSEQWKKNSGQFIPNPSTYLNQGRWKDEAPVEELW